MRPRSIVLFERIIVATILLGVLQGWLGWNQSLASAAAHFNHPATFVLATEVVSLGIMLLLALLISRRRSRVAMWISIALLAAGLPGFFAVLSGGRLSGSPTIAVVQMLGEIVAYALLFTADARRWMRREPRLA